MKNLLLNVWVATLFFALVVLSGPAYAELPENYTTGTYPESTITIGWTPPSTRKNGGELSSSEISGYAVYYYKKGADKNDGEIVVLDGYETQEYTTPVLDDGTYYFAVATIDNEGLYSDLSDYVQATISSTSSKPGAITNLYRMIQLSVNILVGE